MDWKEFCIPKKSGGVRHLCAPNEDLKRVQRMYLRRLERLSWELKGIRPTAFAHGFVRRRNVMTAVTRHRPDSALYLCADIKDFFDNMPVGHVRKMLMDAGANPSFVDNIIKLATYKGRFPQGGPISPMLMNIGMREADMMISVYAKRQGFTYTRYADDIMLGYIEDTVPYGRKWGHIFNVIDRILELKLGLHLSWKKCHKIFRNARFAPRRSLGVVLRKDGQGYSAPTKSRKAIRAGVHNLYKKLQHHRPTDADRRKWLELRGSIVWFDYVRSWSRDGANGADPTIKEKEFEYLEKRLHGNRH